jgi:polyisoprenoid-binding protein YceI
MMKAKFKFLKASTLYVLLMAVSSLVFGQVSYKIDLEKSSVSVNGTSSLHDWKMKVEKLDASFVLAEAASLQSLKAGSLTVDVQSIKSEHSLMNKKTYEALKSDEHPKISVKLVRLQETGAKGIAEMELTIAGKTQKVSDDFTIDAISPSVLKIKGEMDLKMSDYEIKPPVALMGTVKTGDEIKIVYDLHFKQQ